MISGEEAWDFGEVPSSLCGPQICCSTRLKPASETEKQIEVNLRSVTWRKSKLRTKSSSQSSVSLAVYSKRLPNIYMFAISQILPNPIQFAITTNSFSNIQFQPTNPFTNSLVYIPQIRFIFASSGLPIVSGIIPRNRRRRRRHLRPLRQLVPADPGVFLQIRIREVRLLPPALLAGDQALSGACQGSLDEIRGLATTNLCLLGCGFRLG
jgi:hypothetical protein